MSAGIREGVASLAIFIFLEFVLIAFWLAIVGAFGFAPLPVFVALAENLSSDSTTVTTADLGTFVFIIGSFINMILMFFNVAREYL